MGARIFPEFILGSWALFFRRYGVSINYEASMGTSSILRFVGSISSRSLSHLHHGPLIGFLPEEPRFTAIEAGVCWSCAFHHHRCLPRRAKAIARLLWAVGEPHPAWETWAGLVLPYFAADFSNEMWLLFLTVFFSFSPIYFLFIFISFIFNFIVVFVFYSVSFFWKIHKQLFRMWNPFFI